MGVVYCVQLTPWFFTFGCCSGSLMLSLSLIDHGSAMHQSSVRSWGSSMWHCPIWSSCCSLRVTFYPSINKFSFLRFLGHWWNQTYYTSWWTFTTETEWSCNSPPSLQEISQLNEPFNSVGDYKSRWGLCSLFDLTNRRRGTLPLKVPLDPA